MSPRVHHCTDFRSKYPPVLSISTPEPTVAHPSCHAPRLLPIWLGSGVSNRRRTDSTSPVRPRLSNEIMLSPRLTLNLIGEEKLHSHTETVCGTTTSVLCEVLRRPLLRWSDHRQAKQTSEYDPILTRGYPFY
uniref:Uncharacterized protein n=1 Tax=Ananas comosus var. bracteatus TaxID=296719 RepID=A0A6V7QHK9_ANACO|nr:unnamed protein product [Ananas comosus var. bracteatus]